LKEKKEKALFLGHKAPRPLLQPNSGRLHLIYTTYRCLNTQIGAASSRSKRVGWPTTWRSYKL